MGMNHIHVIEQPLGCLAGIAGHPTKPEFGPASAQRQRMVSNRPVIMKANAIA